MKNKIIILIIMIMAIGFASVSTILYINGEVAISSNNEDFDVYFSQLDINGETNNKFIVSDKAIYFISKFSSVGDKDTLKYYITNGSKNYDANVSINCTSSDNYLRINNSWINEDIISARETKTGELSVELLKVTDEVINIPVQCTISVDAISKTTPNNSDIPDKVIKPFELVDDKNNNMFADIGDEIAIGSEHFYIISNDDGEYKALAKYNLYVGHNIELELFDEPITVSYRDYNGYWLDAAGVNSISDILESKGYHFKPNSVSWDDCDPDAEYSRFSDKCSLAQNHNNPYEIIGVYKYKYIEESDENYNIQSPLAIGAHGGSYGNPEFPQYGSVQSAELFTDITSNYYAFSDYDFKVIGEYGDFIMGDRFNDYLEYLNQYSDAVVDVDELKLSDINTMYYKVSGNTLPLSEWNVFKNSSETYDTQFGLSVDEMIVVGDLSEYIDPKYNFLWSTTYWLSTALSQDLREYSNGYRGQNSLFVDTLGHVCNGSFCTDVLGAGIRPVITIE